MREGEEGREMSFSVVQPFTNLVFQFLPNTSMSRQFENKSLTFLPPFPDLWVLLGDRTKKGAKTHEVDQESCAPLCDDAHHIAAQLRKQFLLFPSRFCCSLVLAYYIENTPDQTTMLGVSNRLYCSVGTPHPGTLLHPSSNKIFKISVTVKIALQGHHWNVNGVPMLWFSCSRCSDPYLWTNFFRKTNKNPVCLSFWQLRVRQRHHFLFLTRRNDRKLKTHPRDTA